MKRFKVRFEDGTTGVYRGYNKPEIGYYCQIEAKDENGVPFDPDGYIAEVFEEIEN